MQSEIETDSLTDRQTDTHTYIYIHTLIGPCTHAHTIPRKNTHTQTHRAEKDTKKEAMLV